mgnify:CR=1 FL=1
MSLLLVKYVLTAAIRDRLVLAFLLLLCVGTSLSFFLGSAAIVETAQFTIVFAAAGLRFAAVLSLVLFIVFYLRRSFDARDVEYLLSKPISRLQFLFSHFIAFLLLALCLAVLVTVTVYIAGMGKIEINSILLWGASLLVELIVMAVISLFFAMVLTSAVSATMITFAFYVLSRLIGQILGIIAEGTDMGIFTVLENIMLMVSVFVPRLDLMGQSSWLLYGLEGNINLEVIFTQALLFCGLILSAAYFDLSRRQF